MSATSPPEKTLDTGRPSLLALTLVFARYGNITLGGGSATIATLRQELVERRRWISVDSFTVCFALARLTPGTNLLAFCAGVGQQVRGLPGAVISLLAASIPCAAVVAGVTALFSVSTHLFWVQAAIHGAAAAAVAVTVKTCWTLVRPYVRIGQRLRVAVIAGTAFVLNVFVGFSPIEVLLVAVLAGLALPPAERL